MIEPISRGVLDPPPSRGMTAVCCVAISTSLRAQRRNPIEQRKRRNVQTSGAMCREKLIHLLSCHRPRRRTIQYSRDVSNQIDKPRRTGSPAGACHRARRRRDPVAGDDGRVGVHSCARNDTVRPIAPSQQQPEEIPCSHVITSTTPARSEFSGCWRNSCFLTRSSAISAMPRTRLAPPELTKIHPLGSRPSSPTATATIAESAAIVDYVIRRYGNGAMMPAPGSGDRRVSPGPAHLRRQHP